MIRQDDRLSKCTDEDELEEIVWRFRSKAATEAGSVSFVVDSAHQRCPDSCSKEKPTIFCSQGLPRS